MLHFYIGIEINREHTTLTANTDTALAKLETKFQTKIENTAQKRITKPGTKLKQKNELLESLHIYSKRTIQLVTDAARLPSSGNQVVPVIMNMSEYTKKYSNEVSWYSGSFYTHYNGYRCAYVLTL